MTKIRVNDYYGRIGMVFYVQQRRFCTYRRYEAGLLGLESLEFPDWTPEEAFRCRVFRLARPRMWERLRFCLDKQGRYHPDWEAKFRRVRAEWRGTDMEVWLEPHPILATLRQMAQAEMSQAGS